MDTTGLRTLHATIRLLTELDDFRSGISRILETVGGGLGFEIGVFWRFDRATARFELSEAIWSRSALPASFVEASRKLEIGSGEEIPGTVLNSRIPMIVPDVEHSDIVRRGSIFRESKVRRLYALPVIAGSDPLGVMEFLARSGPSIPDSELQTLLETLAGQIGECARRTIAEKKAQDREALFRQVLDKLPVGVFGKDRHGVYRFANQTVLVDNGLRPEDVLGFTDFEVFPPELATDSLKTDNQVRETGSVSEREIFVSSPANPRFALVKKTHLPGFEDYGFDIFGVVTNITRQKKAEDLLKLSEQRYRQMVDEQSELICRYRLDGTYTFVNQAHCRFFGKQESELVGSIWAPQVHPDDVERVEREVKQIGHACPKLTITSRIFDAEGQIRSLEFVNQAIFDADGKLVEIQAVGRDITERMELEAALQRGELRLRNAMDAAQAAVWDWNVSTGEILVNDLWYRQLGYEPGEVPSNLNTWEQALHPEDRTKLLNLQANLIDEVGEGLDSNATEHRIITRQGELRWIRTSGLIVEREQDGRPKRIVGTNIDITDRKRVEASLILSERRLAHALDAAQAAVWEWNVETGEVVANDLWFRHLGFEPGEASSNVDLWHRSLHPEDMELALRGKESILSGNSEESMEYRILKKSGEPIWLRTNGKIVEYDAEGNPSKVVGSNLDITDRKLAELQLKQREFFQSTILQHAGAAIIAATDDGIITLFNPEAERLLGYSADEMIGLRTPEVFHDRDEVIRRSAMLSAELGVKIEPGFETFVAKARRGIVETSEWTYVRKDGTKIPVFLTVTALLDANGQIHGWLGLSRDISELKRTESALRETELQLSNALQLAKAGRWSYDVPNRTVAFPDNFCHLVPKQNDAWSGVTMTADDYLSKFVHPADAVKVADEIRAAIATPDIGDFRDFEHRFLFPDGQTGYLAIRYVIRKDTSGKTSQLIGVKQDITERKRMELALELSEQRLRVAMEAAQEAVWEWNIATGEISGNDLWFEQLGYKPGEITGNFEIWTETIHPDDRDELLRTIVNYISNRSQENWAEYRIVSKDGDIRWLRTSGSIVERSPEGVPIRVVGSNLDITARKLAEEALAESEQRHRYAMEAAQEAVWDWNIVTNEIVANDLWYQQFGYAPGEVPTDRDLWRESLYPEDREKTFSHLADYMEGRITEYDDEHRFVCRSGEIRWHRSTGIITERDDQGRPTRMVGTNMDITDRKRIEIGLQSAVRRLNMATEAAKIGIWAWNFADDSLEWDSRMFEIYGYAPDDFPNGVNYDSWFSSVHPDDRKKAVAELHISLDSNTPFNREFRIVRPDGTIRFIQAASLVHSDSNGIQVKMIGINLDITEQRDIERILTEAKQAAEAANLAKSMFLAHMSHEVRTPLTAVLGYTDMLTDPAIKPAEALDAVDSIRRNGTHLLTILDDILDLAKIEAGKMTLESIPVSPWQIALDATTLLKIRAEECQLHLVTTAVSSLPVAPLMDPTRIRQVLVNLLSNSVKFTPRKGCVELRVSADQDWIIFEVEDSGMGMNLEQIEHIFEPFNQADSTTTRRFGGTGLGLTITRKLVCAMNGSITARSESGKGSCFTVRLPLIMPADSKLTDWIKPTATQVDSSNESAFKSPNSPQPLKGRILLADDSEDNRRVIVHLLKRHGLQADVVVNGLEAFNAAIRKPYDLILMDMQMPEMDGIDATRRLRASGYDRPIVALTASTMSQDRKSAIEAGCSEFLSKPVEPRVFQATLAKFLNSVAIR
jgi:PAS domain S-box-containing protein